MRLLSFIPEIKIHPRDFYEPKIGDRFIKSHGSKYLEYIITDIDDNIIYYILEEGGIEHDIDKSLFLKNIKCKLFKIVK